MNIEKLSQLLKLLQSLDDNEEKSPAIDSPHPYVIGANYFVRTVTHHHTGRLIAVYSQELVFANAAWIADDGQLQQALETGSFNEVEMFPKSKPLIIGRGSLIDICEITIIPNSQK